MLKKINYAALNRPECRFEFIGQARTETVKRKNKTKCPYTCGLVLGINLLSVFTRMNHA